MHDEGKPVQTGLCKILLAPKNANIALTNKDGNPVAVYTCIQGTLVGNFSRECKSNGEWAGVEPKCCKFI